MGILLAGSVTSTVLYTTLYCIVHYIMYSILWTVCTVCCQDQWMAVSWQVAVVAEQKETFWESARQNQTTGQCHCITTTH